MYNESQRLSKIPWSFYVLLVLRDSPGSPLNTIQLSVNFGVAISPRHECRKYIPAQTSRLVISSFLSMWSWFIKSFQAFRCATLADCRLADLQTCILADLQTADCRLADLQTGRLLWRTERIINLSCTEKSNVCYGQFYMTGLIIAERFEVFFVLVETVAS